jgi:hypothetical protein
VRQSRPDDDFEHFAPSRFDEQGSSPGSVRPDWLTRVDGSEVEEYVPRKQRATGPPPAVNPPPAAEPPAFESSAIEPPARVSRPAAPRPAAQRPAPPPPAAPGPPAGRDSESWEGAVARVELEPEDPPGFVITSRSGGAGGSRGLDLGALQATVSKAITSKPFLILVLALGAVMAVMMFRPRDEQTTSIAAIRRHPERFEGRAVQVSGRVGEVFTVGGGYAFHLHQGRENIVVFTRSRVPVRSEKLTVTGSLSIGTLDGKTRHALFETVR